MEGDISAGKGESRNAARRLARQQRRATDRRARRKKKLLGLLQRAGLLPPGPAGEVIPSLDATLRDRYPQAGAHVLPYWLRAQALDRKLELDELGRALYHLGQRRGFLSNRKAPERDEKEAGLVKKSIAEIAAAMEQIGARTLGEYFASLDPEEERIRTKWTARTMYADEFERIWQAQAEHHPGVLTDELKADLRQAVFYQRPLKSAAGLIGSCSLERGRKRAALALLISQRFRLIQQVNNCQVIEPNARRRPLTPQERECLIDALESKGDLSFSKAKKLIGINNRHKFGFEEGGEKRFVGNRTNAKLAAVFGDRWALFTTSEKAQIVEDVRTYEKAEALCRRAQRRWGLDAVGAERLSRVVLESGYANLSRKAMERLLPHMERGVAYATAVKEVYGEFHGTAEVLDSLPALDKVVDVRNPVVVRVLAELRKVVNAVIRRYGKPQQIRIELARDLRQSKAHRQRTSRKIRANERAREQAKGRVLDEMGLPDPKRDDVLKVLLAEECDWTCPYTGRPFNMAALLGDNPAFDIEHIIPFSRSLDDSFLNKTLCYHEENRNVKGNRTPLQAYGGTDRWEGILARVRAFKGEAGPEKLRRFQLTTEELESTADFTNRQLTDTRYASKLAMQYLGTLYGGLFEKGGRRRVQAGRGGITKYIRQAFHLNRVLGDGPGKSRDDHRHHAVDALATALTEPRIVQALSEAAVQAWERRGKRTHFEGIDEPWPGFYTDAWEAVEGVVTSHRVDHKVNGPLHKETHYARVQRPAPDGQTVTEFRVRKPLAALTKSEVEHIADPVVRRVVKDALAQSGLPPAKAFADPAKHPVIPPKAPGGRSTPIHRVRVRCRVNPQKLSQGPGERYVTAESNHHLEVLAVVDAEGNERRWTGCVVDRLEATRRLRAGRAVIQRDHGPGMRFVFSLAPGDTLQLPRATKEPRLAVVRSVSQARSGAMEVALVDVNEARKKADIRAAKQWFRPNPNALRKLSCRKVLVTPLGEVRPAND